MKNIILRATLNQKRGEDTLVHMRVFGVMHCTTKKRGGCSSFEEARDSYDLEANHRHSPQRDNSYAPRERDG